jgi:hypothetical protein
VAIAKLCRRLDLWASVEVTCADGANILPSAQDLSASTVAHSPSLGSSRLIFIKLETTFSLSVILPRGVRTLLHLPFTGRFFLARLHFDGSCFMEIVASAALNIWKERVKLIFENQPASFNG